MHSIVGNEFIVGLEPFIPKQANPLYIFGLGMHLRSSPRPFGLSNNLNWYIRPPPPQYLSEAQFFCEIALKRLT